MGSYVRIKSAHRPLVTIDDGSVLEGDQGTRVLRLTVSLSTDSQDDTTVSYYTADGTATMD